MKGYLELIRSDLRLALREKSVIFFNYMFPLLFFFIFAELFKVRQSGAMTQVVNMVLVLGVLGNGLWGAGMVIVHMREARILRRFKVAPISAAPLLVSSMVTGWLLYLPAVALVLGISVFFYGMAWPERPISLLLMLSIGLIGFRGIGLILAAVANSMQEVNVLIQLIYMPMLFLTGTLFPTTFLPDWVQVLATFLPATYLSTGVKSILLQNAGLLDNARGVLGLTLTAILGAFISVKLFRWEKEDRAPLRSKAWVIAVLVPFVALGTWELWSRDQIRQAKLLERAAERQQTFYIRGARVFVGDGQVLETASVLIKAGRIAQVFPGAGPSPDTFAATVIDANGKTLLPGLIDADVRLSESGGIPSGAMPSGGADLSRSLAAYLYSGVIAVRSAGDPLPESVAAKKAIASGETLGAELFTSGPVIGETDLQPPSEGAPASLRSMKAGAGSRRMPDTPEQARRQVAELAAAGVDGLEVEFAPFLQAVAGTTFQAFAEEARRRELPLFVRVSGGDAVTRAALLGATMVGLSPDRQNFEPAEFEQLKSRSVGYVPGLTSVEALGQLAELRTDFFEGSLVQQVVSPQFIQSTRAVMSMDAFRKAVEPLRTWAPEAMRNATSNLTEAHRSGAPLVIGTQSGRMLLVHGPAIHRELQLWVEAGVPAKTALQAATWNAARFLGAGDRIGLIKPGYEASLFLVDGNPLTDISATERISMVMFKGERVGRGSLINHE